MIEIRHSSNGRDLQERYDQIFEETSLAQHEMTYRWLIQQLKPEPGRRLLDVACGDGPLLSKSARHEVESFGLDFSAVALTSAKAKISTGRFSLSNGERLPFADNSFDYVTNIGSLEHYELIEQGCQEMARVLKPTGQAMILLPNMFGMLWNIQYVKHTGDVCDDGQPLQRYASPAAWQRLLEENGFVVNKMLPFGWAWPQNWHDWLYYLKQPKLLMVLFVWQPRHFPNLANTLVYICRKR